MTYQEKAEKLNQLREQYHLAAKRLAWGIQYAVDHGEIDLEQLAQDARERLEAFDRIEREYFEEGEAS